MTARSRSSRSMLGGATWVVVVEAGAVIGIATESTGTTRHVESIWVAAQYESRGLVGFGVIDGAPC